MNHQPQRSAAQFGRRAQRRQAQALVQVEQPAALGDPRVRVGIPRVGQRARQPAHQRLEAVAVIGGGAVLGPP